MAEITAKQLGDFKRLYPNNVDIQALTVEVVNQNTRGRTIDWNRISFGADEPTTRSMAAAAVSITPCQMAIGYVVFDVVCLAVGAVGLRASVNARTIESMAEAVAPVLSKIEVTIARMGEAGASNTDVAWGVFKILQTIYTGGSLGAVFSAFTASLTWWDMILYGITGVGTIVAALATDGAAFAAEIVILLASTGFVVSDSVKAVQACNLPPEPQQPNPTPVGGSDPLPFEPVVALKTVNGHTVTIADNGGLGGGDVAIQTDRRVVGPWETFTLQPIDATAKTFALKTVNGNYVTAVNGGGVGGPNDASCPVHTDATWIDTWERLIFEQQPDGTFAICTSSGFYVTASNGGGYSNAAQPINTDRTVLGPWETFTLVSAQRPFNVTANAGISIGSSPAAAVFQGGIYIAFQANDPSHSLYLSSSSDGKTWTTPAVGYPGIQLGSAPAMAEFKGRLYIAFQANDPSHSLYVTSSSDGKTWTTPAVGYPGIQIGGTPNINPVDGSVATPTVLAMAEFNGRLYIAFQANDSSHSLYLTSSSDGTTWTTPAVGYPGIQIGGAPAMAAFNGYLYIAFQANDPSHSLYVTRSSDGSTWTTPAVEFAGITIGSAPTMSVRNQTLFLAFQANDSSHLLYVTETSDGTNWLTPASRYPDINVGNAPALTTLNNQLYLAFQANDRSHILYTAVSA